MSRFSNYKEFATVIEMSEYLGMEPFEIARLIRKGKITSFLEGDRMVVDLESLPDYLL